ncbi:MAG: ABC transporter permease [Pseudomonadota bacterium]
MNRLLANRSIRLVIGLVAPAILLAWWQWFATTPGASAVALAPLGSVGSAFLELANNGTLLGDITATLGRAFTGFAIGASLGVATGTAMAVLPLLNRVLGPLLNGLRQVPMIGWLPLIGLWFGTGEGSELIVVCLGAFFPAMLNTHAGVANVEQRYLDVGEIFRFTATQRFVRILLPAAMPLILTGLTQSLAFAWIGTLASELLMGAGGGLGVTLQTAQIQQRLDVILVTVAITAVLGFAINQIIARVRREVLRWQPVQY